jgi:quinol monooxygenase YgiN
VRVFIVQVFVHVLADRIEEFRRATIENARHSLDEPGVARFDVLQRLDEPARFTLVEVYRTPGDADAHKTTAHYAAWRDAVAPWMAEPRASVKYAAVYPTPDGWESAREV